VKLLHREPSKRLTSHECVSDAFFVADLRALTLIADLEKDRAELQSAHARHASLVANESKKLEKERSRLASAAEAVKKESETRRERYEKEAAKLQRQMEEAMKLGARNTESEAKIQAEQQRLKTEKLKHDKEIQAKNSKLAKEKERAERDGRDAEIQLIAKKKSLEAQSRDVARKEAEVAQKEMKHKVPPWWSQSGGFRMKESHSVKDALEKFMRETSGGAASCGCSRNASKAKIVSVQRIENESLWRMYQTRREILLKEVSKHSGAVKGQLSAVTPKQPDIGSRDHLSSDINEHFLFHGTDERVARVIAEFGFDERRASLGGLYGAGTYFASNSCKSLQYSKIDNASGCFVMLVCRVCMGWPYRTRAQHGQQRIPPDNSATPGRPFDSIFAETGVANSGSQKHNEYVIFDRSQAYPEYLVHMKLS